MKINIEAADISPANSSMYALEQRGVDRADFVQYGVAIYLKNDGKVTFWFNSRSDVESFINRIRAAVYKGI